MYIKYSNKFNAKLKGRFFVQWIICFLLHTGKEGRSFTPKKSTINYECVLYYTFWYAVRCIVVLCITCDRRNIIKCSRVRKIIQRRIVHAIDFIPPFFEVPILSNLTGKSRLQLRQSCLARRLRREEIL